MTITLDNLLPRVFAGEDIGESDVWRKSLTVNPGERVLVQAGSGRGKSSLASFIYGQRDDYEGRILIDGMDVREMKTTDWDMMRRKSISILFQELRLFPELTAMQNVQVKQSLVPGQKSEEEIRDMFRCLGIEHRIDTPVAQMSYGQQQRVALVRALCQPFELLILDEPISHLDDDNARIMAKMIRKEAEMRNAAVIVTSIGKHFDLDYTNTYAL